MPSSSNFARRFINDVPYLIDYLLVVEQDFPELPRDELPPRETLLAAVRVLHSERMRDLIQYTGQVVHWATRAFERAVRVRRTPHISADPAIGLVSQRLMMDMAELIAFEFQRYQRDLDSSRDYPPSHIPNFNLNSANLTLSVAQTPYVPSVVHLLFNIGSLALHSCSCSQPICGDREHYHIVKVDVYLERSFYVHRPYYLLFRVRTLHSHLAFAMPSYPGTFVYQYDNEPADLHDYMYHLQHLYPELPINVIPPLGPLLHAMYEVHCNRVSNLWKLGAGAISWAELAFKHAVEVEGTPHISIDPAVLAIRCRVMRDVARLVTQEVERYHRDVERACDMCELV
ncbi:hypothetical protein FS749_001176 [Ceratobasidium sp. UAMH 11750]|nr:hypothetical protein FS749_001176 [Ceratobasidium sp. UAMH 11750]